MPADVTLTERLELRRPVPDDLDALFAIQSDPAVWTHYPSLRHVDPGQTQTALERWEQGWHEYGLDTWVVRRRDQPEIIGYGGCSFRGQVWNLGYRFTSQAHGHGYATELATAAVAAATADDARRPVVALVLEHNVASRRVVERLGFDLALRCLDTGNPNPAAVRLIYGDRVLTREQLIGVGG